jgi:glycosyltransferase involved in cell wall biosynthesis
MRVGIIAPPWLPVPPPGYGGTEVVVDQLARGIQAAGHDVLLCATADSTCPVPIAATFPRAVGTAGLGSAPELSHVIAGYAAVADWGADVVHDHTLVGPLYGTRTGIPIVTTNHGPFEGELAEYYRIIAEDVAVVAISRHHASTAGATPIAAVIYHGLDVDAITPGAGGGGFALFLGRMNPCKGADRAIRIAKAAGVPLKIASKLQEPEEEAYFREAVEPLLGGSVEFLGEVGAAPKDELLADAMCLLNPVNWAEPFGMVMAEALAHGTPVLAMPCGSVPELIDDGITGFIRGTEQQLSEALPEVSRLNRTLCRQAAVERFSTGRMVDDHLALYRRVVMTAHGPLYEPTIGGTAAR